VWVRYELTAKPNPGIGPVTRATAEAIGDPT
jgi:hypothetical protein